MNDDLERFRIAQQRYYPIALQEIKAGQKRSHWMERKHHRRLLSMKL